jgi:heat shock protein HslJ
VNASLLGLVLMIVAACTPAAASVSTPADTPQLIGTVWQLVAYANGRDNLAPVLPGTQATATFGSNGWVTGSGGCSAYSAVFQTNAINLSSLGPVMSTHQTCQQLVTAQEAAYLGTLAQTATYRFEGEHLVLVQSGGARLAEYSH